MSSPPNILIFHCHDLGKHLGCYGIDTLQTPNIDRFAAGAAVFDRYFCTAPQCSPSRASMFTGRYPHSNGVMGLCHGPFRWDLNPDEQHLAQVLKGHGYRPAAVGVVHEARATAERLGFETYGPAAMVEPMVDATIELLQGRAAPGRPFYIQAGCIEPHRLWVPGELNQGFLGDHLRADSARGIHVPGYIVADDGGRSELAELQGAVAHVDRHFGRLVAAMAELGVWEKTLVVFTADHGIAMPRAKCSLYEPGLEIALLLKLPGAAGAGGAGGTCGRRFSQLLSNVDLLPTLLELAGLPVPGRVQGRSFAALLRGGPYREREEVCAEMTYHEYYDPIRSVRTDRHKLHLFFSTAPAFMDCSQSWRPRSITVTPADPRGAYHPDVELYDLRDDPWEQKNLAGQPEYAAVQRDLLRRLHRHLVATDDPILRGPIAGPPHAAALAMLAAAGGEGGA